MESAIGPLLRTQELNSTLLSNLAFAPQVTALEELAKWNNQLLAGAIDDSLAVRSEVLTNWPRIAEEVGFQSLLPDMVGINTAYEQLIRENTGHLVLEPPRASYMEYIAPTVAMRGYAASVRDLIESESAPVPYGSYDWSSQYPEGRVLSFTQSRRSR